ncbi:conjugal transfer protein TraD [Asaia sp. As-1742]|uniref:conjugal transfer protein TraD n=1 Tax=Asaia sp. As-1742 TaxID=2608325 RepID=UPI00141E7685|nr:conjugal transfer protein TraD [Asaia sp. As-1742]NIE81659.1 conjugal transfer protein TraD [Asaia sp. As-1742]
MRKPRDIDAELDALQKRAKALKAQRTMQLGELVEALGADALPVEALAGVLLSALEQAEDKPEAIARWSERGQAFFQARPRRKASRASQQPADGAPDA